MKKIYVLLIGLFASNLLSAQCTEIFISEVTEGSGSNKYVEIYNGTGSTVYLDDYAFPTVSNAPATAGEYEFWNSFPAGDSILNGDVYVIGHGSADSIIKSKTDHEYTYLSNGDDGFKLVKGGTWVDANNDGDVDPGEMTGFTVIDAYGDFQGDPGSGWDVAGVTAATKDHTLTRKSWYGGSADWSSTVGTDAASSQWIVGDKDDWSGLGSHKSVCTGIVDAGMESKDAWLNEDLNSYYNQMQESGTKYEGSKAGKLPSNGTRIAYQAVNVRPSTKYVLKFWYTMKTDPGSATVAILNDDISDSSSVAGATIASTTVTPSQPHKTWIQDSVEFTTGSSDVMAIHITNTGVETNFDALELVEMGPATPPVVAEIMNPGFDIEGDNSYKDYWTNRDLSSSYNELHITSDPIKGGVKAGKLPSDGTRIAYQAVAVNPMTDYIVKFWYTMKTGTGSAQLDILDQHTTDATQLTANTIATTPFTDQTDPDTYVLDSVGFTSVGDTVAIYISNNGIEVRFDSFTIYEGVLAPPTSPMTAAADPTHNAEDVISIYSESYTDPAGINYYPNWGQTTQYSVYEIGADSMIKYSSLNYQGIDFNASEIDASSMEYLHIDIWTPDVDDIDIFPISRGGEKAVKKTLKAGEWNSIDIPLTDYTSQGLSMADIFQFKFDNLGSSRDVGTIFIDNMYLWKEPTLVYTVSSIADAIKLDSDLAPTNEDSLYELTGVVYGGDLDGNNGLSFTIIDATSGINIFNFNDVSNYVVTEGDEITARGKIDFYNGLLELFVDSIKVNSQGNALAEPTEVEKPSEDTESEFITLRKVWIADTTTVWPDNGNVSLTNDAMDTFQIRIDRDIPGIVGTPVAYDTMTITGIGGQFDGSAPYDEGYQIFPRGLSDIAEYVGVNSIDEQMILTKVYPNPAKNNLTVAGTEAWTSYEVYNVVGIKVSEGSLNNNNLSVANLADGSYILVLKSNDKNGYSRFMINR